MGPFVSLVELVERRARERPRQTAYVLLSDNGHSQTTLTFADLECQARLLAGQIARSVRPGDRVLLVFPTSLEFVVAYFACLIAGAIAVPMMPPRRGASRDASGAIVADCSPALALLSPTFIDEVRADLKDWLARHRIPLLTVDLEQPGDGEPSAIQWEACRDDLAFLQYTSGSTSVPKGVMVSHGNLLDNLEMVRIGFGNHQGSTHVSWLPLYHDMGLILKVLQSMYLGASCVLMTPVRFMHRPLEWLRAIHRYGGEVAAAPNFAYDLCVDRFRPEAMEGIDLSGWKVACCGAEPVRAETMRRFAATFAPYGFDMKAIYPAYGLAEATLFVSAGHRGRGVVTRDVSTRHLQAGALAEPEDPGDCKTLVSCGRPARGLHLAIVEPASTRRLGSGDVGEVWIKGASVAQGYWRNPDQSSAVFHAEIDGEPGAYWLRTGDLGALDGDGELYIVGRLKDVMIIRGVNHHPQDIEATVAASHAALRRDHGAAFTIPDAAGNEQLVVVQEIARGHRGAATPAEIQMAIRAAVANSHEIMARTIVLLEPGSLPRTTSGKIQRSLTRQLWTEGRLALWWGRRESVPAL